MQAVERGVGALVQRAGASGLGDPRTDARAYAVKVVPDDDSALQWSPSGVGLTTEPARTFERLYERYVTRYDPTPAAGREGDGTPGAGACRDPSRSDDAAAEAPPSGPDIATMPPRR